MDVVPNVSYINISDKKKGKKPFKDIVHTFRSAENVHIHELKIDSFHDHSIFSNYIYAKVNCEVALCVSSTPWRHVDGSRLGFTHFNLVTRCDAWSFTLWPLYPHIHWI
jgi:hypothetical protein